MEEKNGNKVFAPWDTEKLIQDAYQRGYYDAIQSMGSANEINPLLFPVLYPGASNAAPPIYLSRNGNTAHSMADANSWPGPTVEDARRVNEEEKRNREFEEKNEENMKKRKHLIMILGLYLIGLALLFAWVQGWL